MGGLGENIILHACDCEAWVIFVLAKGQKKVRICASVLAEKIYPPWRVGPCKVGTICQRPRGCEARLEEPFFLRRAKKIQNFERESSQRSYALLPAGLQRTREGSPLVPALSGQAQTEKVTVCGAESKCFLASCRAREKESEREKAGYFMLMVVPPLDPHTKKKELLHCPWIFFKTG